jgi:hypothetical protein
LVGYSYLGYPFSFFTPRLDFPEISLYLCGVINQHQHQNTKMEKTFLLYQYGTPTRLFVGTKEEVHLTVNKLKPFNSSLSEIDEDDILIHNGNTTIIRTYGDSFYVFLGENTYLGSISIDHEGDTVDTDIKTLDISPLVASIRAHWYQPDIDTFKAKAEELLSQLEELIETMPQKGDTSEQCQKVHLLNKLSSLESAFNGTEQEDLI